MKQPSASEKPEITDGDTVKMGMIYQEIRTDFQNKLNQLEKELYPRDQKMINFNMINAYDKQSALDTALNSGDMDFYNHLLQNYDVMEAEADLRKKELEGKAIGRGFKNEKDQQYLIERFVAQHKTTQAFAQKVLDATFKI